MSSDLRRPLLSEVEPDALPVVTTAELVSPGRPLDSGTVVVTGTLVAEGAAALSTGDNFVAEDDLVTPRAARVATQPPPARRPPLLARPWWQCIVDWCWSRWECVGDCSDALSEDCIRGRCCGYRAHVYSAKLMMACAGCGMVGALCISCALLVSAVKLAAYEEPLNRHGELPSQRGDAPFGPPAPPSPPAPPAQSSRPLPPWPQPQQRAPSRRLAAGGSAPRHRHRH